MNAKGSGERRICRDYRVSHRHLTQAAVAADAAAIRGDQRPHAGLVTQPIWSRKITALVTAQGSLTPKHSGL